MTPVQQAIDRAGLLATFELEAFGHGRAELRAALDRGEIVRIRQGWYANPWLPVADARAARVGGQLACVSAAAAFGFWTPPRTELHVAVPEHAEGLRSPTAYRRRRAVEDPVQVHWCGRDPRGTRTRVAPLTCVVQSAECLDPLALTALAESALHTGLITTERLRSAARRLAARQRYALDRATPLSESGSESYFVHRMASIGIRVRQQVVIPGVGRVDGIIGDRLVIEVDSLTHHSDPTRDRRRDAALAARGYRVLRFMYSQVMNDWASVELAVLAAMTRRDHLATR